MARAAGPRQESGLEVFGERRARMKQHQASAAPYVLGDAPADSLVRQEMLLAVIAQEEHGTAVFQRARGASPCLVEHDGRKPRTPQEIAEECRLSDVLVQTPAAELGRVNDRHSGT